MELIDLKKMLPKIMNNDFWNDLSDTLSDELTFIRNEIDKKKHFYDLPWLRDRALVSQVYGVKAGYFSEFTISGYNDYNTDNGILYWEVTDYNEKHQINIYKNFAKTQLVLQSPTWTTSVKTLITFTEKNASGLSCTAYFTFQGVDTARTNYIEVPNSDISDMVFIAKMYGFDPDMSLDADSTYLEKLVYAIPTFIKNKSMYRNYDIIFSLARHDGDVYNLAWNGRKLSRANDAFMPTLEAKRIAGTLSTGLVVNGLRNYNEFVEGDQYLDNLPPTTLDAVTTWYLDQSFSKLTSKHLGIEYFIGSYIDSNPANTLNLIEKSVILGIGDAVTTEFSTVVENMVVSPLTSLFAVYVNGVKVNPVAITAPDPSGDSTVTGTNMTGVYNIHTKSMTLNFSSAPGLGSEVTCSYLHSMTKEYMNFLFNMSIYNKRAIEVHHVGSQMTFIMDKTGYYDCITPNADYSFANTLIRCSTTKWFVPGFSIFGGLKEIVLGNGNLTLPKIVSGVPLQDNSVASPVFSSPITTDDVAQFGAEGWYTINAGANANNIKEAINTGETDGTETVFSGTLTHFPIKKKSVKFHFTLSNQEVSVIDQYQDAIGFYSNNPATNKSTTNIATVDKVSTIKYNLTNLNILTTTIALTFTIGGTAYTVFDSTSDGVNGVFNASLANPGSAMISTGTINYQTGLVNITFVTSTDTESTVSFTYSYAEGVTTTLDKQAFATVDYETGTYTLNARYDKTSTDIVSSTSQITISNFGIGLPANAVLKPTTIMLSFYLPDGSFYTARDAVDPGDSTIGHFATTTNIASSTINYLTNTVSVSFNNYTSFLNNITLTYTYTSLNAPDPNTEIYAEYITSKDIKITEAGIMDNFGNMIAYATFPPLEMNDSKFHNTYQFFIYYKNTFN
jgi:hypothetical protein